MFARASLLTVLAAVPALATAQAPLATALRATEAREARILVAAADAMPAEHYNYKPTPAQMSFGDVVAHLAEGNDYFCAAIGGMKAPERSKVAATDSKDVLVARLKETFAFCDTALAGVDDSKLSDELPFFGGRKVTRAAMMIETVNDWADHYSQSAIYLRMNDVLPPTAKKP
ncbi:MAG: DinB family protein [Gemmatimonadales bacterium]